MTRSKSTVLLVSVLSCALSGATACQGDTRPGTDSSVFATTPVPTAHGCTRGASSKPYSLPPRG